MASPGHSAIVGHDSGSHCRAKRARAANGRGKPVQFRADSVSSPWRGAAAGCAAACGARPTIDGEQALAPQPLARRVLASSSVTASTMRVALLDVVDRQLVELVLQQRLRELRGGVERQHLRALQIGLGLVELLLGRAFLGDAADFLLDGIDGLAGAVGAGAGVADEQRGMLHPEQRFEDGIGQAALLADLAIEPRRQAAAAEDVVDDIGRHEIRIVALDAGAAERHHGLRHVERNEGALRRLGGLDVGDRRQSWPWPAGRQRSGRAACRAWPDRRRRPRRSCSVSLASTRPT